MMADRRHRQQDAFAPTQLRVGDRRRGLGRDAGDGALCESFRNLEAALRQAKEESLRPLSASAPTPPTAPPVAPLDRRALAASFRDLDDATAQAILNSLAGEDRAAFAGCRGGGGRPGGELIASFSLLDDAVRQATLESLASYRPDLEALEEEEDEGSRLNASERSQLVDSFNELDDAMRRAIENSLSDVGGLGRPDKASDGASTDDDSKEDRDGDARVRTGAVGGLSEKEGRGRRTGGRATGGTVEHVAAPAPNLSRVARRRSDRRLAEGRADARGEERVPRRGEARRRARAALDAVEEHEGVAGGPRNVPQAHGAGEEQERHRAKAAARARRAALRTGSNAPAEAPRMLGHGDESARFFKADAADEEERGLRGSQTVATPGGAGAADEADGAAAGAAALSSSGGRSRRVTRLLFGAAPPPSKAEAGEDRRRRATGKAAPRGRLGSARQGMGRSATHVHALEEELGLGSGSRRTAMAAGQARSKSMIDALEEEAGSLHSGMARLGLDALQGLEDAPIAGKHKKAGRRMSGMLFGKK